MAVTTELVIETNRISYLRPPETADPGVVLQSQSRDELPAATGRLVSLPPDEFHEIGPILRGLGVRVQERKYRPWELIKNLFSPRDRVDTTRTLVYDME